MEQLDYDNGNEVISFKVGDKVRIKDNVPYFSPQVKVIVEIVPPEKMIDATDGRMRLGLDESYGLAYLPEDLEHI